MFSEFSLEIIAAITVVSILVLYFIIKKSSTPSESHVESDETVTPTIVEQEKPTSVSYVKEEEKPSPPAESMNRRKSDAIAQKRTVPEIGPITKNHFTEFAGERILVAEDNPINQKVIRGLLGESGIELVMADDGQEALDILENDANFVMILMDAHMPRIDGFEATRIIRSNPKYDHILIVALSGDTASDDIQKMKDAGMDEQLSKPLRMEALYKIIYAYTDNQTDELVSTKVSSTIENLDIGRGLETCGGDEDFYREILSEFLADYGDSADRLGNLLRFNNIHDADGLLLDIIGVTENIGGHRLSRVALNLKFALRDTDEQSYFTLFDQYKFQLDRLMEDIRAYL